MRRGLVVALLAAIVGFIPLYLLREGQASPGPRLRACSAADGDAIAPGGTIRWTFDRAVRADPAPGGWIRPWGRGSWHWQDPTTLVFRAEELPHGCWLTVQVDPSRLVGLDGARAPAPPALRLAADRLRVLEIGAEPAVGDTLATIRCCFSLPVTPETLLRHLHCSAPTGDLPLRLAVPAPGDGATTLHLAVLRQQGSAHPVPLEQATVQVDAGLLPAAGDCGLEAPVSASVALDAPLRVDAVEPRWEGSALVVGLRCNRPCTAERLERVLSIVPPLPVVIGPDDSDSQEISAFGSLPATAAGAARFTLSGAFVAGHHYAVVIHPAPTAGVTTPRADRLPLTMPDHGPSVSFPVGVGYLGSRGARSIRLQAWNLRRVQLRIWRVYANELASWQLHGSWNLEGYARPIAETTLPLSSVRNVLQEVAVSLDTVLPPSERTDGVYRLDARWEDADTLVLPTAEDHWRSREDTCVISLSDLALQVRLGPHQCSVWCGSLATGAPVPGAEIQVLSSKRQILGRGTCDAHGWTSIALGAPAPQEEPALALVTTGDGGRGLSWLSLRGDGLQDPTIDGGGPRWQGDGWTAALYAERGTYRPGEVAHLRALVRSHDGPAPAVPVRWRIHRPDGALWRTIPGQLDAASDVLLDWSIPADARLGPWRVALELPGQDGEAAPQLLEIQDIVPLHLRASLTLGGATAGRLPAGLPVALAITAAYRVGTPAAQLAVRLRARLDAAAPPAIPDWVVADAAQTVQDVDHLVVDGTQLPTPALVTDAAGQAETSLATTWIQGLPPAVRARPWRLTAQATLLEPGGRALSVAAAPRTIDGTRTLVGLRLGVPDAASGALTVDVALLDPATGHRLVGDGTVTCELYREEWTTVVVHGHHGWHYESQRVLTRMARLPLALRQGQGHGSLTVGWLGAAVVRVCAPDGAVASTSCARTAAGDAWSETIDRGHPDHCAVTVAAATAGDGPPGSSGPQLVAGAGLQVTVRSPFPGDCLVTVETDHVVASRHLQLIATAVTLTIPGDPAWWPGVVVSAIVVRPVLRGEPWRVHRAFGRARVALADPTRVLAVALTAPADIRPGSTLPVAVALRRWDGRAAAGAHATIAVVDEGILALTSFPTPDPLAVFAAASAPAVALFDPYDELMPEVDRPAGTSEPGGDLGGRLGRFRPPLTARRTLASWWSGGLVADADGHLAARVPLPPSGATTLRVMVVADLGCAYGSGTATVRMATPVLVAAEWPRALAPGDRLVVPVTLQNASTQAHEVHLAVTLPPEAPLRATGAAPALLQLAPGATTVVRLELRAEQRCGTAHPVLEARWNGPAGEDHARDEAELVVRPPAASEIRGGEIELAAGDVRTIALPGGWLPGATTASVVLAPAPQWSLPDALERLDRYPAGCSEQTVSTCLPLLALPRLVATIDPWRWSEEGRIDRLQAGIAHLLALQCADGGLAQWPGDAVSWDFGSAYAAGFLVQADQAGLGVPRESLDRLLGYCRGLVQRGDASTVAVQALAADALVQAGRGGTALLDQVADAIDAAEAGGSTAEEEAVAPAAGSPGGADPTTWRAHLLLARAWIHAHQGDHARLLLPATVPVPLLPAVEHGSCADQALWLEVLAALVPDHPQLLPLARAIADPGRWRSTLDTAAAVTAIAAVQALHPPSHPYREASLVIGDRPADSTRSGGTLSWQGADTPVVRAHILGPTGSTGVLRWLVCGVPLAPPSAVSHGLRVERRLSLPDGGPLPAVLHAGDALRVELRVEADLPCDQVLVEDLLAGCLTVEEGVATGGVRAADAGDDDGEGAAVERAAAASADRLSVYDDRTLLVGACRPMGARCRLIVRYRARLTAAGTFLVPPLRARCMQDEAVTGVGATTTLTVRP